MRPSCQGNICTRPMLKNQMLLSCSHMHKSKSHYKQTLKEKIQAAIQRRLIKLLERRAKQTIQKKHPSLFDYISEQQKKAKVTGSGYSDYLLLHKYITKTKPTEILECGTGTSTLVIAHALKENEKQTGIRGTVTSIDDIQMWHEEAKKLCPSELRPYIDYQLSNKISDNWGLIQGWRYAHIPHKNYTFMYIDGPTCVNKDKTVGCNMDFLHVVEKSDSPITMMIDMRKTTVFALHYVFGKDAIMYDYIRNIGWTKPLSKHDIGKPIQIGYNIGRLKIHKPFWFFQRPWKK